MTNRAIQYRLDDVVGVENWYNRFKPWHKFVAKVPGKEDYALKPLSGDASGV